MIYDDERHSKGNQVCYRSVLPRPMTSHDQDRILIGEANDERVAFQFETRTLLLLYLNDDATTNLYTAVYEGLGKHNSNRSRSLGRRILMRVNTSIRVIVEVISLPHTNTDTCCEVLFRWCFKTDLNSAVAVLYMGRKSMSFTV